MDTSRSQSISSAHLSIVGLSFVGAVQNKDSITDTPEHMLTLYLDEGGGGGHQTCSYFNETMTKNAKPACDHAQSALF